MRSTELLRQFIRCFTYNLQLLHKTIVNNMIMLYLLRSKLLLSFFNISYSLKNVLQTFFISNRFSHKSLFYLC